MSSKIDRLLMRFILVVSLSIAAVMMTSVSASAQMPTQAQQHALRANCVSDYRANCATVPTGGMAALVCLEQHVDKLSSACKAAVLAVEGHPAAATPAAAPSPAASSPSTQPSPPPSSAPSTSAAQAAPAAPVRAPLPFFQEIRIAARACARDFHLLCPGVPMGHGNAIFCLRVHANRLDTACRNALMAAGEQL